MRVSCLQIQSEVLFVGARSFKIESVWVIGRTLEGQGLDQDLAFVLGHLSETSVGSARVAKFACFRHDLGFLIQFSILNTCSPQEEAREMISAVNEACAWVQ